MGVTIVTPNRGGKYKNFEAYIGGTSHVSMIKAYAIITATNVTAMAYNQWHKQPQIEYKLGTT